jgi:hypothetical protein
MIDKVIANAFLAGAPIFTILRTRDLHTHEHCARVARLAWYPVFSLDLTRISKTP